MLLTTIFWNSTRNLHLQGKTVGLRQNLMEALLERQTGELVDAAAVVYVVYRFLELAYSGLRILFLLPSPLFHSVFSQKVKVI